MSKFKPGRSGLLRSHRQVHSAGSTPRETLDARIALIVFALAVSACGSPSSTGEAATTSAPVGSGAGTSATEATETSNPRPAGSDSSPSLGGLGGIILFGRSSPGTDDRFFTLAPGSAEEQDLGATGGCTACADLSRDGTRVMVPVESDSFVRVAVMKADATDYQILPAPVGLHLAPGAWSPMGDQIVYDGWDDAEPSRIGTYTSEAGGSDLVQIIASEDGRHYIPLAYSPDGSRLLVFREGGYQTSLAHVGDLLVVDVGGGNLRQLNRPDMPVATFDITGVNPASWSPAGDQVAFGGFEGDPADGKSAIFVADVTGGEVRQVTEFEAWLVYARWSPSGDWIAFGSVDGSDRAISIVRPDGSDKRTLTDPSDNACCAEWSPDGAWLLHQRGDSERQSDLWVMNLEGEATQLTHQPGLYLGYQWSEGS